MPAPVVAGEGAEQCVDQDDCFERHVRIVEAAIARVRSHRETAQRRGMRPNHKRDWEA